MSDDTFIGRWSRRKREAETEKHRAERPGQARPEARTEQPAVATAQPAATGETRRATEPPFDPATLPSIESIVAGTDIRAFLQKGVPAELTKAALRRAWSTDPAIRDFIEIAENQWDFTDPTSIPGFGPLRVGDDVRQLTSQAMGKLSESPPAAALTEEKPEEARNRSSASTPADQSRSTTVAEAGTSARSERESANDQENPAIAASQQAAPASDIAAPPRRKGHGAAMPR